MIRFQLHKIQIDGPGKLPATIDFGPGLNTVVGSSDTGKSYIFHAINYLLGASAPPRENPHSRGYNRGWLQLSIGVGKVVTIERVFGEDDVNIYDTEIEKASIEVDPVLRPGWREVKL